jgi:hypothetical protein
MDPFIHNTINGILRDTRDMDRDSLSQLVENYFNDYLKEAIYLGTNEQESSVEAACYAKERAYKAIKDYKTKPKDI